LILVDSYLSYRCMATFRRRNALTNSRRLFFAMFAFLHSILQLSLAGLRLVFVLLVVGLPAISPLVTEVIDSVVEVEVFEDCEACVANSRQERRFSRRGWAVAKDCVDSTCRSLAVKRHSCAVDGHRLHNGMLAPLRC
jgi:hypothetical protein